MTAPTLAPAPDATARAPARDRLRPDIQALRALAVGSVMLFHLWPNRLRGGYVGVDVFFVISGFLITSHLVAEVDATGRVHPGRFWARRAKRLVPASSLVLLSTAVAVVNLVPHYLWRQFFQEIIASTLQFQNWLLAHNSVDYLAANNVSSPTQHFWTLSVEEQFYVGLPLLLLAVCGLTALVRVPRRKAIAVALLTVAAASLAYSVWLTHAAPTVSYFSTFTRAWEFAVGALIAFVPARRARLLPWLGIAAIAYACVYFNAATPFPGYAAALPVLGTALVIWCGEGSLITRLGAFGPIALLGRVSYPAYLWHWPLLILWPYATDRPLGTVDKVAIIAATVLLSWLSTTLVEEPIRFGPRLLGRRRPLVVALWCGSAMAVVVSFAGAMLQVQSSRDARSVALTQRLLTNSPRCFGAQAMDPKLAPCHNTSLDGVIVPDPAQAVMDDANQADCWGVQPDGTAKVCHLGPATGYTKRLFAFGDSHNNALIGVYRQIAVDRNWRIDVTGKGGCYFTTADQPSSTLEGIRKCLSWRASVLDHATHDGYDGFIVTHSRSDRPVKTKRGETVEQVTVRGLVAAWRELPNAPIVAIVDNPGMPRGYLDCVITNRATAATTCSQPRSKALGAVDGSALAARQVPRAHVIDLSSFYCTTTTCSPVIGGVLVYRDITHITSTYATTLLPYIEPAVVSAFEG